MGDAGLRDHDSWGRGLEFTDSLGGILSPPRSMRRMNTCPHFQMPARGSRQPNETYRSRTVAAGALDHYPSSLYYFPIVAIGSKIPDITV